jgi:hypothetical protein
MLKQNQVLSNKMRIVTEHYRLDFFESNASFYSKYSSFTFKALRRTSFQNFLGRMLSLENIDETTVNTIDINVYPAPRKNGNNIAGKCNIVKGKIRIYPKPIKFCIVFRKKFGKDTLFAYAGNRARAALIHELLHLKYASDETKVRELTESYFSAYSRKRPQPNSNAMLIYKLLFLAGKI